MNMKNYYPLQLREFNTDKTLNGIIAEIDGLTVTVAELVNADLAQQLIEAYNEKYGPKVEEIHVDHLLLKDLKIGQGTLTTDGNRVMKIHGGFYLTTPRGYGYIHDKNKDTSVTVVFVPDKTAEPIVKNSAHSFTEGSESGENIDNPLNEVGFQNQMNLKEVDVKERWEKVRDKSKPEPSFKTTTVEDMNPAPAEEQPTLDEQIEWLRVLSSVMAVDSDRIIRVIKENLLSIKRWNSNPLWKQMDVEKVITDLLKVISIFEKTGQHNGISKTSAIQNAEAALGMLQAFKENRDKPSSAFYGIGDVNTHPQLQFKTGVFNSITGRPEDDAKKKFSGHIGSELTPKGESIEMPLVDGKLQKIETSEPTLYQLVKEIRDIIKSKES
jgi:hypothetical protein